MKTTIDIADDLLVKAKRLARQRRETLREVVEEGLRLRLAVSSAPAPFRLQKRVFHGEGLHPTLTEGQWETVRDLIYRLG